MENLIETLIEPQLLFDDGHQHVNREGDPHLRLHGVGGGAIESLDVQVLFDPAKEQFDLSTRPIQLGDGQWEKEKIVGREGQPGFLLGVEVHDAAQRIGIALRRPNVGQANMVWSHRTPLERSTGREVRR